MSSHHKRSLILVLLGVAPGLIIGAANAASAYTAIKRQNGNFCHVVAMEWSSQPYFNVYGTLIYAGHEGVCPIMTEATASTPLRPNDVTTVEVGLKFNDTSCPTATKISTCVEARNGSGATCSSTTATASGCNTSATYTLTGSEIDSWTNSAATDYAYIVVDAGSDIAISGYKYYR